MIRIIIFFIMVLIVLNGCKINDADDRQYPDDPPNTFDKSPQWSPDGSKIVYTHIAQTLEEAEEKGSYQVWTMDNNGENNEFVTEGDLASWSPDGKHLSFEKGFQIFTYCFEEASLFQLTFEKKNYYPSWSPDGQKIIYDSNVNGSYEIWIMNKNGTDKICTEVKGRDPEWSPNGDKFAYDGMASDPERESDILVGNVEDYSSHFLTDHFKESYARYASWSPDGEEVVCSAYSPYPYLYIIKLDKTEYSFMVTRQEEKIRGEYPDWSPDGNKIVYSRQYIWVVNIDGSNNYQLTY